MKKFVSRLLLFCLAPLPLLYLLGYVVDTGLHRSRHFFYSEWNDLFAGKINADLIICGTSRAWVQISPQIIDSGLHLDSYNLGMDGSQFNVQYARFKLYLQHNKKPKYIIQEVGYTSTLVELNELPLPQQFLPYLSDSGIWNMTRSSSTPFSLADRYFPVYKYNNELPLIKEGILSYMGRGVKSLKYKGYEGKNMAWDSSFYYFTQSNPRGKRWTVSPKAVALFRDYLTFCKANDIKVIMVYPPAYIESLKYILNKEEIMDVYKKFAADYNIPFLNHMYDPLNYSRSNFYNSLHLNKAGAELFSRELVSELKPYVQAQ